MSPNLNLWLVFKHYRKTYSEKANFLGILRPYYYNIVGLETIKKSFVEFSKKRWL